MFFMLNGCNKLKFEGTARDIKTLTLSGKIKSSRTDMDMDPWMASLEWLGAGQHWRGQFTCSQIYESLKTKWLISITNANKYLSFDKQTSVSPSTIDIKHLDVNTHQHMFTDQD